MTNDKQIAYEIEIDIRQSLITAGLQLLAFTGLLILKLTGVVGWSWWLITLPIWIMPLWFSISFGRVVIGAALSCANPKNHN